MISLNRLFDLGSILNIELWINRKRAKKIGKYDMVDMKYKRGHGALHLINSLLEVESRTHGSRPGPKAGLPRTDPLVAECSRPKPRTQALVFSKKRVFKKIFQAISKKQKQKNKERGLQTIFSGDLRKRKIRKIFANFPRGFWLFPSKF